jgi:hypothetical protein
MLESVYLTHVRRPDRVGGILTVVRNLVWCRLDDILEVTTSQEMTLHWGQILLGEQSSGSIPEVRLCWRCRFWEGIYVLYNYNGKRSISQAVQKLLSTPVVGNESNILRHMTFVN